MLRLKDMYCQKDSGKLILTGICVNTGGRQYRQEPKAGSTTREPATKATALG